MRPSTNPSLRFGALVFKNLWRRPLRTALTVAGLAVGIAAVVALVGISEGFERSFVRLYQQGSIDVVVTRHGKVNRASGTIDASIEAKIRQIQGVCEVTPGLVDLVAMEEDGLFGVFLVGWRPDSFLFDGLNVVAGRRFRGEERGVVLLGSTLARNLEKTVGDPLQVVEGETFQVVGVFESHNVVENGMAVLPLEELQRLMDRQGQVTGFNVQVADRTDRGLIEGVCRRIEGLAKNISAMPTAEFVHSIAEIRTARAMAWLTSVIAILVGAIGVTNTTAMSVVERTQEIGILRAIGWRKSRIVRMIASEAVLLTVLGAVLGVAAAIVLVRGLTLSPAVNGLIDGRVAPGVLLEACAIALVIGLASAAYPAFRASRLPPTLALRHE